MNIANWIMLIIQILATIITGSIGYFFKKALSRLEIVEKNQYTLEHRMAEEYMKKKDFKTPDSAEIIREIKGLEIRISQQYVKKEDYNIAQGEVMHKLDRIYDILMERKDK